jgi:hypothetical protein
MISSRHIISQLDIVDVPLDEGISDLISQFSDAFHLFVRRMTLKILPDIHKHIQEQHPDKHFSQQVMKEGAEATLDNLSPKRMYQEVKEAIKIYGWRIGAMVAFWELFEHFILPGILIAVGLPKTGILTGTLPVGEIIFYPLAFKALNKFKSKEKEIIGAT